MGNKWFVTSGMLGGCEHAVKAENREAATALFNERLELVPSEKPPEFPERGEDAKDFQWSQRLHEYEMRTRDFALRHMHLPLVHTIPAPPELVQWLEEQQPQENLGRVPGGWLMLCDNASGLTSAFIPVKGASGITVLETKGGSE